MTGAIKKMDGGVTVDGKSYRFMGSSDILPAMEQTTLERIRLRTQAQAIADEIMLAELIYT